MPEREVESPVNTRNSTSKLKPPRPLPISPGARSDPGRAEGPKFDAVPMSQLRGSRAAHQEEPPIPPSSTTTVVGPED
jgi:hypothetical protein